jgi:flagellar motor switch/type III secretory pathway protein FliN
MEEGVQDMSDIDTEEEPEDILEQLRLDEFLEWQDEQEAEELKEEQREAGGIPGRMVHPIYDNPTPVEMDLARHNLGPDFGYVVYYAQPH